jgi:acetyltransferase-like isoleucine patch superfamily enzyme
VLITVPLIHLGARSHINAGCKIIGRGDVYIGDNVSITYGVMLITSSDTPQGRYMSDCCSDDERQVFTGDIIIKDGAYIGSGAKIMPNVIIGENAVIGANAYIDKDVPDNTIVIPKQELIFKKREIDNT